LICITSYQAEDTPGRELTSLKHGDSFDLKDRKTPMTVNAEVKSYILTSHAGGGQTVEMIKKLQPKRTFLIHGDNQARRHLKERLYENECRETFVPEEGNAIIFGYF
jgi:Cft2 family RNA processing exonuclease